MKSICYIVPYFGKLPQNFQLWLHSCSKNKTINWIIFTNDKTNYDYPNNVKAIYKEFSDIKELIQRNFEFKINIDNYWRLSFFKPAYGEIFKEYLEKYDFWGYCDIDLIWGDIRKFITEEILDKYERIGFQGHSTLFKNSKDVNSRYRVIVPKEVNYIEVFSGKKNFSFDENGMDIIYDYLNIKYYKKTIFAHLSKYDYSFVLKYLPQKDDYKNFRQVFLWNDGHLYRYFINKEKKLEMEEFMYIHFFCRPITYIYNKDKLENRYIIYPDKVKPFCGIVTKELVKRYGKNSKINYYFKSIYLNRKKITVKKIYENTKRMIAHKMFKKY